MMAGVQKPARLFRLDVNLWSTERRAQVMPAAPASLGDVPGGDSPDAAALGVKADSAAEAEDKDDAAAASGANPPPPRCSCLGLHPPRRRHRARAHHAKTDRSVTTATHAWRRWFQFEFVNNPATTTEAVAYVGCARRHKDTVAQLLCHALGDQSPDPSCCELALSGRSMAARAVV